MMTPNISGQWAAILPSRIPSLDGLRAISILLVILGHSVSKLSHPKAYQLLGHFGNLGVKAFFLISGFLITTLLLKEWDKSGGVSLKNFYIRRSLRIFPAFLVYVGVVVLLEARGMITLEPGDVLHALTYTMNYHMTRGWVLNHLWSLSVEEQFYLLWPAVLLLAAPGRAWKFVLAAVAVAPLIRAVMWFGFGAGPTAVSRHFEAVCDALACGCALAFFYNRLGEVTWYTRLIRARWYLLIPPALMLIAALGHKVHPWIYYVPGQTLANFGILLLLDRCIRYPEDWFGDLINWAIFRWVGVISYSLYLWQELFLDYEPEHLGLTLPWNLVLTFAVSAASYYLVEKQFLKLKDRATGQAKRRPAT